MHVSKPSRLYEMHKNSVAPRSPADQDPTTNLQALREHEARRIEMPPPFGRAVPKFSTGPKSRTKK